MEEVNSREVQNFLDKLNWKVNAKEMNDMELFQVDVFKFKFNPALSGDIITEFTAYMQGLKMKELSSVKKIFVWLYQHEISFKLVFGYNSMKPFWYNASKLSAPGRIRRELLSRGHESLMACPLDKL